MHTSMVYCYVYYNYLLNVNVNETSYVLFSDFTAGLINGENITEIKQNALFLNETENITSTLTFENLVTFQDNVTIAPNKTIDGVDLDELDKEQDTFRRQIADSVDNLTDTHRGICYAVSAIHNVVEGSLFRLNVFCICLSC